MTNLKLTKRALLSSVMALFVCFAMLLGTTFAWFTDSAVSSGNLIQTGTLDVELYQHTDAGRTLITDAKESVFPNTIKWEPGYTHVVYLSIKNNGTLALKYRVELEVTEVSAVDLTEEMSYTITPDAQYGSVTSWDGTNSVRVNKGKGTNDTQAVSVDLAPGAEHYFALSVHMDEDAPNKFMNQTIAFDIKVLAGQATAESDAFGPDYDADAGFDGVTVQKVDPTKDNYVFEVKYDQYNVGSMIIPADAVADDADTLSVSVDPTVYQGNITVGANETVKSYEVKVTGLKEDNQELIKVSLKAVPGLDPNSVKLYHYDTLIADAVYNPTSGYVTFETDSFSPFTIVYDANDSFELPTWEGKVVPSAVVTYEEEYVGAGKITEWNDDFGVYPTEGLDADLEAAFTFACPEEDDETFDYWYCDFYVSLDKDLGADQIFLGGCYGEFGWVGFHNGDITLEANEEIGLLESVTVNPWTYADIKSFVGTFICGVGDVDDALNGATFTVKLRLTNPEDTSIFFDVNVVTYTFGGTYNIQ